MNIENKINGTEYLNYILSGHKCNIIIHMETIYKQTI